jgi:DNA-binding FadR family transcriptional regulator
MNCKPCVLVFGLIFIPLYNDFSFRQECRPLIMSRPKSVFTPLSSTKLRKQSLREQAVGVLKRHIVEANLQPGANLPTERDLSQGLAVSRTVVREALTTLEAEGLVERRPSAGYFLTLASAALPAPSVENVQPLLHEKYEVRLVAELGIAHLVIARITDIQLDELERKAYEIDRAMDRHQAHAELEIAFHLCVWAMSQNASLVALGRQILGDYFRALALARPDTFVRPAQDASASRHIPLVQALRTRDLAIVQEAVRAHCGLPAAMRAAPQGDGNNALVQFGIRDSGYGIRDGARRDC